MHTLTILVENGLKKPLLLEQFVHNEFDGLVERYNLWLQTIEELPFKMPPVDRDIDAMTLEEHVQRLNTVIAYYNFIDGDYA